VRLAGTKSDVERLPVLDGYLETDKGHIMQVWRQTGKERDPEEYSRLLSFEKRMVAELLRDQESPDCASEQAAPEPSAARDAIAQDVPQAQAEEEDLDPSGVGSQAEDEDPDPFGFGPQDMEQPVAPTSDPASLLQFDAQTEAIFSEELLTRAAAPKRKLDQSTCEDAQPAETERKLPKRAPTGAAVKNENRVKTESPPQRQARIKALHDQVASAQAALAEIEREAVCKQELCEDAEYQLAMGKAVQESKAGPIEIEDSQ